MQSKIFFSFLVLVALNLVTVQAGYRGYRRYVTVTIDDGKVLVSGCSDKTKAIVRNQIEDILYYSKLSLNPKFEYSIGVDGVVTAVQGRSEVLLGAVEKAQLESWARSFLTKNAGMFQYYDVYYPPHPIEPCQPVVSIRADGSISIETEFPWLPAQINGQMVDLTKKEFPALKDVRISFDEKDGQLSISGPAPPGFDIRGFFIGRKDSFKDFYIPLP